MSSKPIGIFKTRNIGVSQIKPRDIALPDNYVEFLKKAQLRSIALMMAHNKGAFYGDWEEYNELSGYNERIRQRKARNENRFIAFVGFGHGIVFAIVGWAYLTEGALG